LFAVGRVNRDCLPRNFLRFLQFALSPQQLRLPNQWPLLELVSREHFIESRHDRIASQFQQQFVARSDPGSWSSNALTIFSASFLRPVAARLLAAM
jgi:hypothetical protein